jgi:hypothetical protein
MKVLCFAMLLAAAPAFAETATPLPSAPATNAAKTDFTKPFVYDALSRQAPKPHVDHPTVEVSAGPGTK